MLTLPFSCQNKVRAASFIGPDPDAAWLTSNDDPRPTRVDRITRRSSIDVLPQLLNDIQGRMSGGGPRAHTLDTWVEGRRHQVYRKLRISVKWSMWFCLKLNLRTLHARTQRFPGVFETVAQLNSAFGSHTMMIRHGVTLIGILKGN
jgi:Bacterial sugar transferase